MYTYFDPLQSKIVPLGWGDVVVGEVRINFCHIYFTYPVLLVFSVVSLANADAVALTANSFVVLGSDGLSSLESYVASHLRGHRCQSQRVGGTTGPLLLHVVSWLTSKRWNWQLESASRCLRHLLPMAWLVIGTLGCCRGKQRLKHTAHKLRLELVEVQAGLSSCRAHRCRSTHTDMSGSLCC